MLRIDHLAVSAASLEDGADHVAAALGFLPGPGGRHDHMGTYNRLLSLGPGEYLEVIAVDPDAPRPAWPRWFGLDNFDGAPRITNWVVWTDDLDAALATAPEGTGTATALARGDFRWRMAVPPTGRLPFDDAFPALIEWQGGLHPTDRLPDMGCRLMTVEIAHPEARDLERTVGLPDARLRFVNGPKAIRALIATPAGNRWLA